MKLINIFVLSLAAVVAIVAATSAAVWFVWNLTVPELGGPRLTFWLAVGVTVLSGLLVRGGRSVGTGK